MWPRGDPPFGGSENTEYIADFMSKTVDRDSAVGIATRYGLDGPGIESRWGAKFPTPVQTGPAAHPASCTVNTGSFSGIKRPERGVEHAPLYSAEVKERV
jgi:hypothetical protein